MLKQTILIFALLLSFQSQISRANEATPPGFNWDNWADAVNTNPCHWFSQMQLAELLGEGVQSKANEAATSSSCQFTAADGGLLLTASVRSLPSSSDGRATRLDRHPPHGNTPWRPRKDCTPNVRPHSLHPGTALRRRLTEPPLARAFRVPARSCLSRHF